MNNCKKYRYKLILISVFFCSIIGCKNARKTNSDNTLEFIPNKYSKQFCISRQANKYVLFNISGTDTERVDLVENNKLPRVAVLSTVFAGFLEALNLQHCIVGLDKINYYNDSIILKKYADKSIKEIGEEGNLRIEDIIALKLDYLIVSSFSGAQKESYTLLKKFGIKIIFCDNFKEQHPLARAEWLKFFGVLFNCYPQADSLFNTIETNYNSIKTMSLNKLKPKVLTDAPFGDSWFVPGGNSFTAKLIEDAGGEYLFKHKMPLFSYALHIEEVLTTAHNADVWLNINQYKTLEELAQTDKRYTLFKPFKNKMLFNNNKQENSQGGNVFWEIGAARPDWILSDMNAIISKNYSSKKNWYFYNRLK